MPNTLVPAAVLLVAVISAASTAAMSVERTPGGVPYATGGIGLEESELLEQESTQYRFALRVAANGSGAYLADVDLVIRDAAGTQVFQRRLDGPWLLIDLPAGRYEVVGVFNGQVRRLDVDVPARGHRQAVMYFVVEGETRPFRPEEEQQP